MTDLRVYVADLADYNAGTLRGIWLDPTEFADAEEFEAAVSEFVGQASDENGQHEEWAIHDFEAPAGVRIEEYAALDSVFDLAALFAEFGEAYAAYVSNVGAEYATRDGFEETYAGEYDSERDFAYDLAAETVDNFEEVLSQWPWSCVDWDHAARELRIGGDYSFVNGYAFRSA